MDFIVDFNTWVFQDKNFHEDRGKSLLENDYGNKCCLGFCTEQILPWINMKSVASPFHLMYRFDLLENHYKETMQPDLTSEAMEINDTANISWRKKILYLQLLFSIFDHTLTFINVPPATN